MKTKKIFAIFMSLALLSLPAVSLASTYDFIDTSGNRQSVEANSFAEALDTAHELGIHSGVVLMGEETLVSASVNTTNTTNSGNFYQFIDTSGNLQGVWAENSSVALATAHELGIHSGVVLVSN